MKRNILIKLGILLFFSAIGFLAFNTDFPFMSPYNGYEFYSFSIFIDTWHNLFNGSFNLFLLPVDVLYWCLSQLIDPVYALKFFYIICFVAGGMGAYNLGVKIYGDKISAFCFSSYYSLSIFATYSSYWHPNLVLISATPYFLSIFVSGNTEITNYKYSREKVFKVALVFFLLTGQNLTYLLYLIGAVGIFLLPDLYRKNYQDVLSKFRVLILGGVLSLFFSAFYYPVFYVQNAMSKNIVSGSLALESPSWKSSNASPKEVLREMGSVNYYYMVKDEFSYKNAQIFNTNILFYCLSYAPFLLLVFSALFIPTHVFSRGVKDDLYIHDLFKYLPVVFVIAVFFSVGVNQYSPTSYLFQILYKKIPYFSIFRDSYKAILVLHVVYSLYIGYFANHFRKPMTYLIVFLCTILLGYPFWRGDFLKYEQINIPKYWQSFHEYYVNKKFGAKVILTPEQPTGVYTFTAQRGKSSLFFRSMLNNNAIHPQMGNVQNVRVLEKTYSYLKDINVECFVVAVGKLGISNILNLKDVDTTYYNAQSPHMLGYFFDTSPLLQKDFEEGNLTLYELDKDFVYPLIYSYRIKETDLCSPNLVSPVKNKVYLNSIIQIYPDKPETIIHNTTYDPAWRLLTISKNKFNFVGGKQHTKSNFNTNEWFLPEVSSDTMYMLIYVPEIVLLGGIFVSLMSFFVSLLWIIWKRKS